MTCSPRMPALVALLATALAASGLGGCLDFDAAYGRYCRVPGRCDAGTPGTDGGSGSDNRSVGAACDGSGNCAESAGGTPGAPCLGNGECPDPLLCDPVSRTCASRWCMEAPLPYPGCCSFTSRTGACGFQDGRACLMPSAECAADAECCSGTCAGGQCALIQFY